MSNYTGSCSDLVNEVDHLISLPSVCFKILELSNDEHSTARDIEQELKNDPGIATQVLSMANSAFYGVRSTVDTLSRAVSVIGTKRISKMVLAVSAIKSLQKFKNDIISLENFWYHSISCGVIASHLAKQCCHNDSETLFLAGLLHDIGQLVLFNKRPEQVKDALKLMYEDPENRDLYYHENKVLGFNHMQLGGELARLWHLPDSLIEPIAYHHVPTSAIKYPVNVSIIHIANSLSTLSELNSDRLADGPKIHPVSWQVTNLNPEICIAIMQGAKSEYKTTQAALIAA